MKDSSIKSSNNSFFNIKNLTIFEIFEMHEDEYSNLTIFNENLPNENNCKMTNKFSKTSEHNEMTNIKKDFKKFKINSSQKGFNNIILVNKLYSKSCNEIFLIIKDFEYKLEIILQRYKKIYLDHLKCSSDFLIYEILNNLFKYNIKNINFFYDFIIENNISIMNNLNDIFEKSKKDFLVYLLD